MFANRARWSDNDHYLGPFTYSRDRRGYSHLAVVLGSGDGDDYPGCSLRVSGFGHTFIVALPPIIRPWKQWVDTSRYGWSGGPGTGYWDSGTKEYGFTYSEGHLSVALGRVTNDSSTEQRWGFFIPWTQWRHVRRSFYGIDGKEVAMIRDMPWKGLSEEQRRARHLANYEAEKSCPTVSFEFEDFDGERITAATRIEEREWRFGDGWFKWLSLFRRPMIKRSLDLRFAAETGRRKGSWKGGTLGHSIVMLPGELHESAFRRYCAEHDMAFIGPVA